MSSTVNLPSSFMLYSASDAVASTPEISPTFTGCIDQVSNDELMKALELTSSLGLEAFSKIISPDKKISVRRTPLIYPEGSFILQTNRDVSETNKKGCLVKSIEIGSASFKTARHCFLVSPTGAHSWVIEHKVLLKHLKILSGFVLPSFYNPHLEGKEHLNIHILKDIAKIPHRSERSIALNSDNDYVIPGQEVGREICIDDFAVGTLAQYPDALLPLEKIQIARDSLLGLQYLHQNELVHNDIKPDNFFIFFNDSKYIGKISDLDDVAPFNGKLKNQPFFYRAPESMERPFLMFYQSEIFSIGVTLSHFLEKELSDSSFDPIKSILLRMKDDDPANRPSLEEAIATFDRFLLLLI